MLWTLLVVAVAVVCLLTGFLLGRWFERSLIYARLLRSDNPQSWRSAHRVEVPEDRSSDDDNYPATPSRPFTALETRARERPTRVEKPPVP